MVSEAQVKAYYDRRHREKGCAAWRPPEAFPHFLDLLGVDRDKALLDVGCGTGYLLQAAAARGLRTCGVDISEEAVRLASAAAPKADVRMGKGEELPFEDGVFEYVCCLGALEHFIDMEQGMREMIRVAKPDARFCVLVPNVNYLYWKLSRRKGTEQQDLNERLLSLKEWTAFFEGCGLKVERVHQDRWWFMRRHRMFASLNPLAWFKAARSKLKWLILPLPYTYQFIFILRHK